MQREAEEGEAAYAFERLRRLGLRGHAPAKRLAARDDFHRAVRVTCRLRDSGADRRVTQGWRVGALGALLHVGKLIAQRANSQRRQFTRNLCHERMRHPGSRTMREHIKRVRVRRQFQQA
jgi:hypothetical protein